MNEGFAKRVEDPRVVGDIRTVTSMIAIYCKGNHSLRNSALLQSDGAELELYGGKPPLVCDECARLIRYAERRRAFCPKDPKPFCSHCDTHCYAAQERERVQEVMRYAGPRSLFTRHFPAAIRHAVDGLLVKKSTDSRLHSDKTEERGPDGRS